MVRRFLAWQIIIATAVVVGLVAPYAFPSGNRSLRLAMQTLPTLTLMLMAAAQPAVESPRYRWGIFSALAFSLVGGYFLDVGEFVKGVLGFLAANLAYITAFTANVRFAKHPFPFVVLGCLGGSVLAISWRGIPNAHVLPICLYAVTIVSISAQAITRGMNKKQIGSTVAAVGATLLLISDSAIGLNIYHRPLPGAHFFIMATYFVGQWLIASSVGNIDSGLSSLKNNKG